MVSKNHQTYTRSIYFDLQFDYIAGVPVSVVSRDSNSRLLLISLFGVINKTNFPRGVRLT